MASYGLEDRFRTPKECYRLLDPTAYSKPARKLEKNKYPFLSNTPRKTGTGNKSYTESLYFADFKNTIPNVTSLKSKVPRFPYKSFNIKDLEDILCRCGYAKPCECPTSEEFIDEIICQSNVRKRLFKGPPPAQNRGGLSCPSKRDHGFEILPDGSTRRIVDVVTEECPPFYDARVNESTEYYHGCKWSKWTSKRAIKSLEVRPGPADYTIRKEKTQDELCAERVRAQRRAQSKQPRYVEQIQRQLIREGRPGPADYDAHFPAVTNLKHLGSKAERFPIARYEMRPCPNTYFIKRAFELPVAPISSCRAQLPEPACFGIKAARFSYRVEQRPGPAEYNANVELCKLQNCSKAPFGVSAQRFQTKLIINDSTDEEDNIPGTDEEIRKCPRYTWQFKSRTSRFPQPKNVCSPPLPSRKEVDLRRPIKYQYACPFYSSLGRFQPWSDWLPVHSALDTPGPGNYKLTKPLCLPAVHNGPLFRAPRFTDNRSFTPAPNEYQVGGGVETVLATHNKRLKENEEKKNKFKWVLPAREQRKYSPEQRELKLIEKAIAQLEVDDSKSERSVRKRKDKFNMATGDRYIKEDEHDEANKPKQKLLRTFLYRHPITNCI